MYMKVSGGGITAAITRRVPQRIPAAATSFATR